MRKGLKITLTAALTVIALLFIYRFLCIRTVNYEIAGIKIPSRYNILTGKITPLSDYKGGRNLKTIERINQEKIGLTDEQVTIAKFRWAVFEQWVSSHPKYKGWQDDERIFRAANEAFKNQIKKGK